MKEKSVAVRPCTTSSCWTSTGLSERKRRRSVWGWSVVSLLLLVLWNDVSECSFTLPLKSRKKLSITRGENVFKFYSKPPRKLNITKPIPVLSVPFDPTNITSKDIAIVGTEIKNVIPQDSQDCTKHQIDVSNISTIQLLNGKREAIDHVDVVQNGKTLLRLYKVEFEARAKRMPKIMDLFNSTGKAKLKKNAAAMPPQGLNRNSPREFRRQVCSCKRQAAGKIPNMISYVDSDIDCYLPLI